MTINKYDKFAILPKKCVKCRKTFILEPYNIYIKQVGIECHDLEQIYCKSCSEIREKAKRLAEQLKRGGMNHEDS